jgi:hypothetical protein
MVAISLGLPLILMSMTCTTNHRSHEMQALPFAHGCWAPVVSVWDYGDHRLLRHRGAMTYWTGYPPQVAMGNMERALTYSQRYLISLLSAYLTPMCRWYGAHWCHELSAAILWRCDAYTACVIRAAKMIVHSVRLVLKEASLIPFWLLR